MNTPSKPIWELKILALNFGDKDAYTELNIAYLDEVPGEFYPIASKMADRFEYPQAYFDAYSALLYSKHIIDPDSSLEQLDRKNRNIALLYLFKGALKGHDQSKEYINLYFNKHSKNRKYMDSMLTQERIIDSMNILSK
jgi:hypothetical protein